MGTNTLLTLVMGILLARSLGPENYGTYAFVLSVITLIGLPAKAGLPTLVIRETAKNQLKERWEYLRGLLRLANGFVVGYAILASLVTALIVCNFLQDQDNVRTSAMLWSLWLLPIIAFGNIRGATLRGLRKVVQGQLPEKFIRPFTMVLLLSGAMLLHYHLHPVVAIQFYVCAAVADFTVGAFLLIREMPNEVKTAKAKYQKKVWASSLLPLSLFTGLKIADSQIIIVIIGTLGTSEDVGLFRVAAQGAALVSMGMTTINMVLSPYVARLYHSNDFERLQKMVITITRVVFVLSLPIALMMIIWGKVLIEWIFGVEYIEAASALSIMTIGQLFNVSAGSVAVILNMAGFEKESLKGVAVAFVLNVISSVILIPIMGLEGAALSSVISLAVWNIILMRATINKVGIHTFILSNLKQVRLNDETNPRGR